MKPTESMTERAQALEAAIGKAQRAVVGFSDEIREGRVPVVGAVRDHLVLNLGVIASFLSDALLAVQPPPPAGSPTTEQAQQQAFIAGVAWLHAEREGDHLHPREVDDAEEEALRRYPTPVAPAGASESPCLWREDGPTMVTGCGVRHSMLPRNPIKQGWKACPYCKAPLNE